MHTDSVHVLSASVAGQPGPHLTFPRPLLSCLSAVFLSAVFSQRALLSFLYSPSVPSFHISPALVFFPFSLLSLSFLLFPIPSIPLRVLAWPPFFSLLTGTVLIFRSLQLTYWYFPLTPTPSLCHIPHHPFFHLLFFFTRSLSFLFLSDIHNWKNSRRKLTHTWPGSVSPQLSSITFPLLSEQVNLPPIFYLTFSSFFQACINLFFCGAFNRDPDSCEETPGKASDPVSKSVRPSADREENILTYSVTRAN